MPRGVLSKGFSPLVKGGEGQPRLQQGEQTGEVLRQLWPLSTTASNSTLPDGLHLKFSAKKTSFFHMKLTSIS